MKNLAAKVAAQYLSRTAQDKTASGAVILGTNHSSWSWEDDNRQWEAELMVNNGSTDLYLKIEQTHTKYGLGAGKRVTIDCYQQVGTLAKPDYSKIRELLKKESFGTSRSGAGFKAMWLNPHKQPVACSTLIEQFLADHPELVVKKDPRSKPGANTFDQAVKKLTTTQQVKLLQMMQEAGWLQ